MILVPHSTNTANLLNPWNQLVLTNLKFQGTETNQFFEFLKFKTKKPKTERLYKF